MQVHSIFTSMDGEVNPWGQGTPSIFVRLQGCNLRCSYCDIPEAQEIKDDNLTAEQVLAKIEKRIHPDWPFFAGFHHKNMWPKVTITGGEPLLQQEEVHHLLNLLFPLKMRISIETNGTISLSRFRNLTKPNPNVSLIVDWKFDQRRIAIEEYLELAAWDWIKFVIADREHYELVRMETHTLIARGKLQARVAFSPIHESLPAHTLAKWILDDRLWWVTLNLQLHKYIGLE